MAKTQQRATPEQIAIAQQLQASERVEALVDVLKTFDDDPRSLSTADLTNLRQWAARCYVATRRMGPYAMTEAAARQAGVAAVMGNYPPMEECAFELGLRAYFDVLEGIPEQEEAVWHSVKVIENRSQIAVSLDFVCPRHFPALSKQMHLPVIPPHRKEVAKDDGRMTTIVRVMNTPPSLQQACVVCADRDVASLLEAHGDIA